MSVHNVHKEVVMVQLGEKIRSKRKERGYSSLRRFAQACSMSPSFLSDIELGKSKPSIDTLAIIAANLDVPASDLLDDGNPPSSPSPEGGPKEKPRPIMKDRHKRKVVA